MTFAGGPSPFADIHGPPDAEEFERFDPTKILEWRVVKGIDKAVFSELEAGIGNHDQTPRGVKWKVDVGFATVGKRRNIGY